jgi:hypothetical protein
MVAVAIWNVSEAPEYAGLWSLQRAQTSRLLTPPPTETQSQPQIAFVERQGPKSMGTNQIGFPMSGPSPSGRGEVRAPNQDESLSSLVPGDGGGLRLGLVTGLLIAAFGLGWAWVSNPYLFLKSDLTSTLVQQPPFSVAPQVDQETASGGPIGSQGSTPTGSDLGNYRVGGEPIHRADQGVLNSEDASPSSAPKATAMKPAAVPLPPGKNVRHSLTPTPDTRPNTIQGWKVKHVSGGTVMLQGPDGVHKASVGDTVPGAGRIDSIVRWGGRLLVATSKGLITTD